MYTFALMKDYEYFKQIAFGENLEHEERPYAKELVSIATGEGFSYDGNFYHGDAAITQLNKLLLVADQNKQRIVALESSLFDGSTEIELS
jgi:hypothetical protein